MKEGGFSMEERLAQGGGGCRGGGGAAAEAVGAVYPGALVAPSSGLLAVARAVAARGQDGCLGSARPAAWLAASSATGQQEEEQGRAGSTGARAGAQGLARGPYRGRAPLSGVRLAARTAAAAGAMSKFSGTTCLQEGEEACRAPFLHTDHQHTAHTRPGGDS